MEPLQPALPWLQGSTRCKHAALRIAASDQIIPIMTEYQKQRPDADSAQRAAVNSRALTSCLSRSCRQQPLTLLNPLDLSAIAYADDAARDHSSNKLGTEVWTVAQADACDGSSLRQGSRTFLTGSPLGQHG